MNRNKRVYVSNRFALDIDKTMAGWLYTAEGGQSVTETVQERLSAAYPVRKHPGNVKVEDISISFGTGMSSGFYKWLADSMRYDHTRKDGAIVACNYDYKEITRQNFYEALIAEIGFPALDAHSKDACRFSVKIATERTETEFAGGTQAIKGDFDQSKQKKWTASNFRVSIDGLPCNQASKVEAITIKQNIVDNTVGERLIFEKEPAQIDFPNVVLTIPEIDAKPWYQWHDDFVVRGNSTADKERTGMLEYLSSDLGQVLFTLSFKNLGIIKYTPDKSETAAEKLRMVKVEMYCEQMEFKYSGGASWNLPSGL